MPYWCPYSRSKRPCVICALILLVNLPFNRSWPGISSKSPVSESIRLEIIWTHRTLFATKDGNKLSYILTRLSAFMRFILAIGLFDKNYSFFFNFWNLIQFFFKFLEAKNFFLSNLKIQRKSGRAIWQCSIVESGPESDYTAELLAHDEHQWWEENDKLSRDSYAKD